MMRKRIGGWLLILALGTAPGALHAQDVPYQGTAAVLGAPMPAAPSREPPSALGWFERWCKNTNAPAVLLENQPRYTARGQDIAEGYDVVPVHYTGPLSHPRYNDGGLYVGAEFLYFKQSRPILSESVAYRGFLDTSGAISGNQGTFIGSHTEALNTNQVQGPGSYQPGLNCFIGYRFQNGVSVSLDWWHLTESRYSAGAGIIDPNLVIGALAANTFLFAPVTNFPNSYGGNFASVVINGVPQVGATFGIWNAASEMTEQFIQRFEMVQLNTRVPFWETETYRAYGVFGPRAVIMWEKYEWRTVQRDVVGQAAADTSAYYNNITSNRLYGAYCGSGHDWYIGRSPIGAWAIDLQLTAGLYVDFVKERSGYELGDKSEAAHRATNQYTVVPGLDGKLGLMWYPWEAIQLRFGYNFMAFFNTMASPRPIDFNYGTINPEYSHYSRLLHGFDIGIALVF
jgi:hypothetical protein